MFFSGVFVRIIFSKVFQEDQAKRFGQTFCNGYKQAVEVVGMFFRHMCFCQ